MAAPREIRWVGIDWGDDKHHVCVVDAEGKRLSAFVVAHSAEGIEELIAKLLTWGPIGGIAIETTRNLLITALLNANFTVYPINSKVSKKWRESLRVQARKDDGYDAFVLAYHLRYLHSQFAPLRPDDPATRQLRELCEGEVEFIGERTAKAHQIKAHLKQYYPEALGWFQDFTGPTAADFLITFPTAEALRAATDDRLKAFLRRHHVGLSETWLARVAARQRPVPWQRDEAIVEPKSLRVASLAKRVRQLHDILKEYRRRIEALYPEQPDAALLSSLPGLGPKLAPRLLTHLGTDRTRYQDAKALQALSGCAPVKRSSGKKSVDAFRWACRKGFRNTLFLFALQSIERSLWARAYYDQQRAKGHPHAEALRALGGKWLKIIFRIWQDRDPYDEQRYLDALARRNSPLVDAIRQSEKCEQIREKYLT